MSLFCSVSPKVVYFLSEVFTTPSILIIFSVQIWRGVGRGVGEGLGGLPSCGYVSIAITIVRSYSGKYLEFVAVCIVVSAQHVPMATNE